MKRSLAFASMLVLVLGASGSASAADMAVKAVPPPVPTCGWCGFYIGGNAGGIWTDDRAFFGGDAVATLAAIARGQLPGVLSTSQSGFIGGVQVGYNQQSGNFVWGIEADWQGTSLNRTVSFATDLSPAFFPTTTTAQEKLDFLGTVRGRVGFTVSPTVLLYATGGLAYGDPSLTTTVTTFPVGGGAACAGFCGGATTSAWRAGWTAGVGGEWKFLGPWSAKLEYLYYDLGRLSQQYGDSAGRFPTTFVTVSERFTGNIVRVGINYAFSATPVVAKY
ncbi:outer membrane beta-barrel protein [Bradyrhizobium sp. UFLA05-109]